MVGRLESLPDPIMWAPLNRGPDQEPKEAINVFDFEPVMRKNVPPAHFGYMASGIDDEVTLRANREGFLKFQLRPRRLVDVSKVDMSTDILGVKYDTPIIVAPVGGQKAFHPEGEIAVARAREGRQPPADPVDRRPAPVVEDVTAARGAPIWYQLYATNKWEVAKAFVTRAENGGLPGGRGDGGSQRRPQPGNPVPAAAHRHARLHRLPRPQQPAGEPRAPRRCIRASTSRA